MRSVRSIRVLTVVSLAIALLILPIVAEAAPRLEPQEAESSWLANAWGWVSSLWGAGGGGWDPTSVRATTPSPTPRIPAVSDDARSASQAASTEMAPRRP